MLVLSRRVGEKIVIGDEIVVTIVEVHRDSVRLGVDAPRSVPVNRAELVQAVSEENTAALTDTDMAAVLSSLSGIKPKSGNAKVDIKRLLGGDEKSRSGSSAETDRAGSAGKVSVKPSDIVRPRPPLP